MEPEEQSDLDLHCLTKRLQRNFSDDESRRLVLIGSLRVNKCEVSGTCFHKIRARLRCSNN